jgi:hypothetical protein
MEFVILVDNQKFAFVICDNVHGYFAKDVASPVNITPPYGSNIKILEIHGEWAWVLVFGIKAWVQVENIGAEPPPSRVSDDLAIAKVESLRNSLLERVRSTRKVGDADKIEYGPRGGRFVRTKLGFRRYF